MSMEKQMMKASEVLAKRMRHKEITLGSNKFKLYDVPMQGYAISLTEAELRVVFNDGAAHGYQAAKEGKEWTKQ